MTYKWIIPDKIAITKESKDSLFNNSPLNKSPFAMLVTVENDDYRLIWRYNNSNNIRHYMYSISEYPTPSPWELYEFNIFLDYELRHNRKILLWFDSDELCNSYKSSILTYFSEDVHAPITRPHKLTHCTACEEEGCMTELLYHTSSLEDAKSILQSGSLLSSKRVRHVSYEDLMKEGRNAAGDPADYFDYVMLSYGNCMAGDRLVTERRLGDFPTDYDLTVDFQPGIRYYFITKDMETDDQFCSDGYHAGKMKEKIILDCNLLLCIIPMAYKGELKAYIHPKLHSRLLFVDHKKFKGLQDWSTYVYALATSRINSTELFTQ